MKLWKLKFFIGQHDEDGFYCFVFAKNAEEARKIAEEKIFAYYEKRFASAVEVKIDDFTFSGPKLINIVATLSTNTWNNVTTKQGKIKNYSLEKVKVLDNVVDTMNESWENDF